MSTRRRCLLVLVAVATATAAACASEDDGVADDTDAPAPSVTANQEQSGSVPPSDSPAPASDDANGIAVTIEPSPYSPIAAVANVTADDPVTVSVTATAASHVVEVPTTATAAMHHAIPIVGMRQGLEYSLEFEVRGQDGEEIDAPDAGFTTGIIDRPLPEFQLEVADDRSDPGFTIVEFDRWQPPDDWPSGQAVVALDDEGEVVWYYSNTGSVGDVRLMESGTVLSHYFPVGIREIDLVGTVVENYQVVPEPADEELELRYADAGAALDAVVEGNEGDPPGVALRADWVDLTSIHHEVVPMPNGNFLALSTTNYELTPAQQEQLCPGDDTGFAATSDVVVEFERDGTVVRTWDLWDVIDIETTPGSEMCTTDGLFASVDFRDWTHANAVIYDEARDAVIVSVRHTDQIIALDHLDETGPQSSVRWILGRDGTIPLDGDAPYYQHAVELQTDGSLLLYDNGNGRPGTSVGDPIAPTYSRAVLYGIDDAAEDESTWSAAQLWEHRVDDLDGSAVYASFLGDADRLANGNVLIDHGGIDPPDGFTHVLIIEVVPDGKSGGDVVWQLMFGDAEEQYISYRAQRVTSLYTGPDWER